MKMKNLTRKVQLFLVCCLFVPCIAIGQYSMQFNSSSSDYALKTGVDFASSVNTLTMEFWVSPVALNQYSIIANLRYKYIVNGNWSDAKRMIPYIDTDNQIKIAISKHYTNVGDLQFRETGVFFSSAEEWHHVAIMLDGNYSYVYVDGVLVLSSLAMNGAFVLSAGNEYSLSLAAEYAPLSGSVSQYSNVQIEEFRIWKTIRTFSQINANMYNEVTPDANLVFYYKFNEGSGSSLTDASSYSNDATLFGSPSWNAVSAPSTQASNLVLSEQTSSSIKVSWTNGNGSKRVVFARQGNSGSTSPTDDVYYTANSTFGGGTAIGNWYCVYNGSENNVIVSGLSSNTDYIFQVFEYNGILHETEKYNANTATDNPKSTSTNSAVSDYGLTFDGTDDYVTLPNALYSENLSGGTAITIEYWFKGTVLQSPVRFQYGGDYLIAGWDAGTPEFVISSDGGGVSSGVDILGAEDEEWHHVACVWSKGGTMVTYVDGAVSASRAAANVNLPGIEQGAWLGSSSGTSEFTNGQMDEVRIWSTARTQQEIQDNMSSELAGNESGLVAYYRMNEGSGTRLYDNHLSSTYDGTINGPSWSTPGAPFENSSEPTSQASSITFSDVNWNQMTVNWTRGDGSNCIVFAKQTNTGSTEPIDGTSYTANSTFGSGTQIGSTGWFCVYNGASNSVTVSGLSATTDYIFQVFEQNGNGVSSNYLTTTATDNPKSQATAAITEPTTQASSIVFSPVSYTTMTASWTNGNGSSRAVFMKQANTGTTSPVDNTTYTANTVFGSGTQVGSGWYCIYNGTGTSVSVTGLSVSTDYIVQVFEYNGNAGAENYLTSTATDNPKSQASLTITEPTTQASSIVFSSVAITEMTISWANGNGSHRAAFIKQANSGTALPVDNISYTANTTFGSGTQIGSSGWYCVYNGTENSVSVDGLSSTTDYICQVFEYNGYAGAEDYLTSTAGDNPNTTTTIDQLYYALSFDGTNDDVTLPNTLYSSNFSNGSAITIEYWFKGSQLLSPVRFQSGGGYLVAGWSDPPQFIISTDGGTSGVAINGTGDNVEDGAWHHIACVWQKNTTNGFQAYLDGAISEQKNSGNVNLPSISSGAWLGSIGNGEYLNGQLDEVRIWNVARTAEQIQDNMFSSLVGNESGLVAYYQMSDGSSTTLSDNKTSGTAYDGTINGATWTTPGAPPPLTWEGTLNPTWNTKGNWDYYTLPNSFTDVVIANTANQPVIASSTGLSCKNLTVNSGATITVNSGGSLITYGTIANSGTINVKQSIAEDNAWHLIAMPNAVTTANTFNGMYLQQWNENTGLWSDVTDPAAVLNPLQGYSLWVPNGSKMDFTYTGTPNTGNQNIAISASGTGENKWMNFMGNPYPSYLDWGTVSGYGTKYTWNGTAYTTYTEAGIGSGSQYVAPMEAFFIYKDAGVADNFSLTNAMRTHQPAGKKTGEKGLQNGLVLYASNGSYNDDLWIVFDENATENFELERDAWKILSSTHGLSQLWTVSNDGNLAVDVRPETETIQLGFANDQAGVYSISLKEIEGIGKATLEDTKSNTFHNLQNGAYEFAWEVTDNEMRFKLHLNAVGIEETPDSENGIFIYTANGNIYITASEHAPMHGNVNNPGGTAQHAALTVTNIMGRVVLRQNINLSALTVIPANLQTGIYLVNVQNEKEIKTEKVFIK